MLVLLVPSVVVTNVTVLRLPWLSVTCHLLLSLNVEEWQGGAREGEEIVVVVVGRMGVVVVTLMVLRVRGKRGHQGVR